MYIVRGQKLMEERWPRMTQQSCITFDRRNELMEERWPRTTHSPSGRRSLGRCDFQTKSITQKSGRSPNFLPRSARNIVLGDEVAPIVLKPFGFTRQFIHCGKIRVWECVFEVTDEFFLQLEKMLGVFFHFYLFRFTITFFLFLRTLGTLRVQTVNR